MPLQDYGAIMRSAASLASAPVNSYLRERDNRIDRERQAGYLAEAQKRTAIDEQNSTRSARLQDYTMAQQTKEDELRRRYQEVAPLMQAPEAAQRAYIEEQKKKFPDFANSPLADPSIPPAKVIEGMIAGIEAGLGKQVARPPGEIGSTRVPGVGTVITQGGQHIGFQGDQRAPIEGKPADQRTFEWYQTLSPEQKAEYDRLHPAPSHNPQVIPNPAGYGPPSVIVQTPNGPAYQPLPPAQAAAPAGSTSVNQRAGAVTGKAKPGTANARGGSPQQLPEGTIVRQGDKRYKIVNGQAVPL